MQDNTETNVQDENNGKDNINQKSVNSEKNNKTKKKDEIVDYYLKFDIDRKTETSEIFNKLQSDIGRFSKMQSDGALNDPSLFTDVVEFLRLAANAAPHFSNDKRRAKYDKMLKEAYDSGKLKIDEVRKKTISDIYDRLNESFKIGNYQFIIETCLEAMSKNIHDYKIYDMLATAYFNTNKIDKSFETIENGLKINPDNLILLKRGARQCVQGQLGVNKAQEYINRMIIIDPNAPLTVSEQIYLFLQISRKDDAFLIIDKYIEMYPDNEEFRQICAQDLIAYSNKFYIPTFNTEGVRQTDGGLALASKADYEDCLEICNKAASLCANEATAKALETVKIFGEIRFNFENINSLLSLLGWGVAYCCTVVMIPIGLILFFCTWRLYRLSYRPYWQINQFYLTGKREPAENRYIKIGKFFTWYLQFTVKAGFWIFKTMFRLVLFWR